MSLFGLRRSVFIFIVLTLAGAILVYALFEGRRVLSGPLLTIETPVHGSATSSAYVLVSGFARNISFLTINGLPAYIDEHGKFSATLSPASGYAIFTVAAVDRFGREKLQSVAITVLNYCPIDTTLYV